MDVSTRGLTIGHFLGVPAVLAEIAGFWFVSRGLAARGGSLGAWFFATSASTFSLGAAFHAMFAPIGLALKQAQASGAAPALLTGIANAVRPVHQGLGVVVVFGILAYSLLFAWAVASGRSAYPRWVALSSPVVFILGLAPVLRFSPLLRSLLAPCALNLANLVLFGVCLFVGTRRRGASSSNA
jgi:hypothetical protein